MESFNFPELLIFLLIGLLFFKEQLVPVLLNRLGFKNDSATATKGQVNELAEYVNHRQTEIMEEQTKILSSIKEGVDKANRQHETWEKYGIKARCEKES